VELFDQIGQDLPGDGLRGERLLVVFDGHCGFCNRSIRWLLRRDRYDRLRFVPFDSPQVAALLRKLGFETATLDPSSILVIRPAANTEAVLQCSNAVIAALRVLPGPWPTLAALLSLIPRPLRDAGYRLVAHLRFFLGGRLETCPIPTSAERARFIGY